MVGRCPAQRRLRSGRSIPRSGFLMIALMFFSFLKLLSVLVSVAQHNDGIALNQSDLFRRKLAGILVVPNAASTWNRSQKTNIVLTLPQQTATILRRNEVSSFLPPPQTQKNITVSVSNLPNLNEVVQWEYSFSSSNKIVLNQVPLDIAVEYAQAYTVSAKKRWLALNKNYNATTHEHSAKLNIKRIWIWGE